MTKRKHFKQRVRGRMAKTGEAYSSARHQIIQQASPAQDLDPAYLEEITGMTNRAVTRKTGRDWAKWVAVLDTAQADRMKHPEIAKYLHEQHQLPGWWAQMVTVGYERVRGLRAVNEKADGFAINKSKTIEVPVTQLFGAWDDALARKAWLHEEITVSKSTPLKSLRGLWSDGRTRLDVYFYPKGEGKSQVNLQHSKLRDGKEAEAFKAFWGQRLEDLKQRLEG